MTLTKEQLYIRYLLQEKCSSVLGMQVQAMFEENGQVIEEPIFGNIISIVNEKSEGNELFTCEWDTGIITNCKLYQFVPVRLRIPKNFHPEKIEQEKRLTAITTDYIQKNENQRANLSVRVANAKKEISGIEESIKSYQTKEQKHKSLLKELEYEQKIEYKPKTRKDFLEEVKQIKKLASVDRVFLNTAGELVIVTNMLHPVKLTGKKEVENKKQDIGSFIISLNTSWLSIINRNFTSTESEHEHPHVVRGSSDICFGSNRQLICDLINEGKYFQLVDFLLTFLSAWNVSGAGPYVQYDSWMAEKQTRTEVPLNNILLEL